MSKIKITDIPEAEFKQDVIDSLSWNSLVKNIRIIMGVLNI